VLTHHDNVADPLITRRRTVVTMSCQSAVLKALVLSLLATTTVSLTLTGAKSPLRHSRLACLWSDAPKCLLCLEDR
jgi:hypothetical protein